MLKLAEPYVLSINPYVPSRPLENQPKELQWAILASNENCLGPSPLAQIAALEGLNFAHLYPNATRYNVVGAIVNHFAEWGIKASQVALGNGTSELIVNLVRGLVGPSQAVLFPMPSFVMYRLAARAHGREELFVKVQDNMRYDLKGMLLKAKDNEHSAVKMIFLANPNNPTGDYVTKSELDFFINELPEDIVLVIDEAYFEYVTEKDYPNGISYALKRPRTLILRTFSKAYGLAGLRVGYAIGDEKIIDVLCRIRDPFNVNVVAQYAAVAALQDKVHVEKSVAHNLHFRPLLIEGLKTFDFDVYDSVGNFVLAKRAPFMPPVAELCRLLFARGVIIRNMDDFGLLDHVRVSVGTKSDLTQLFKALEEVL